MKASGELVCFGANDQGRCDVPADLGPVVAVAAGFGHTCAVKKDGELVCFGANDQGQRDVPDDLGPVVAVAAGWYHTCAMKARVASSFVSDTTKMVSARWHQASRFCLARGPAVHPNPIQQSRC